MRVLHLIDGLGAGGAEKLIVETVPELVKGGIQVDVLLLNGEKTSFYRALEKSNTCRIFSLGKSFYNPFYILKIIPYLKKYDLVHVHLFPAQYFAVLAKVLSGCKVKLIFTEHSTGNRRLNNPRYQKIEKWIYKYYNSVIAITDEVKEVLIEKIEIPNEKILTIENGINISKIQLAKASNRRNFGYTTEDIILIMVAGMRLEKDHDTVLKSLLRLPDKYKLILVGDGVRRKQLENLVFTFELENRVLFLGVRNDVYSLIKMADVAILSSHWEGFGLAAVESMACGVATIASNVPGLANVVDGGGLLFERGNEEDLRDKILSLENKQLYEEISRSGEVKSSKYDIKLMVDKVFDLYIKMIK